MEPEKIRVLLTVSYVTDLTRDEKDHGLVGRFFRMENVANQGLPLGWSWKKGEYALSKEACEVICELIEKTAQRRQSIRI
ncbi:MAG: hypothetical protein LRY63_02995 [Nitrincola sp.]|nr:hypothetical protein [Nitrincola sp.]